MSQITDLFNDHDKDSDLQHYVVQEDEHGNGKPAIPESGEKLESGTPISNRKCNFSILVPESISVSCFSESGISDCIQNEINNNRFTVNCKAEFLKEPSSEIQGEELIYNPPLFQCRGVINYPIKRTKCKMKIGWVQTTKNHHSNEYERKLGHYRYTPHVLHGQELIHDGSGHEVIYYDDKSYHKINAGKYAKNLKPITLQDFPRARTKTCDDDDYLLRVTRDQNFYIHLILCTSIDCKNYKYYNLGSLRWYLYFYCEMSCSPDEILKADHDWGIISNSKDLEFPKKSLEYKVANYCRFYTFQNKLTEKITVEQMPKDKIGMQDQELKDRLEEILNSNIPRQNEIYPNKIIIKGCRIV